MGFSSSLKSHNPFRHSDNSNVDDVPPPSGPPPGYLQFDSKSSGGGGQHQDEYAPPPGPPPASFSKEDNYTPPPGPPPSSQGHDWQSIPLPEDTSGYPPPPAIFTGHDRSWSNNATEQQAEEGERWCRRYPLLRPIDPSNPALDRAPQLVHPQSNTFHGNIKQTGVASWMITTTRHNNDNCVTVQPPLYVAARDDPRVTGRPRSVYFEVVLPRDLSRDAGVGIGFVALPYPAFRMPGWHRGSLAVHSDDGHKYVNDRWGGNDFAKPWGIKGVVGIGMTFSAVSEDNSFGGKGKEKAGGLDVEVFFTRNGKVEARWDVNEERDQKRDLEPVGVQGFHDLVAAVGSFEKAEFEVVLDPERWIYKDVQL